MFLLGEPAADITGAGELDVVAVVATALADDVITTIGDGPAIEGLGSSLLLLEVIIFMAA